MGLSKYGILVKDRQTGKSMTIYIEATTHREAKQIAMRDYGIAYEIIG